MTLHQPFFLNKSLCFCSILASLREPVIGVSDKARKPGSQLDALETGVVLQTANSENQDDYNENILH